MQRLQAGNAQVTKYTHACRSNLKIINSINVLKPSMQLAGEADVELRILTGSQCKAFIYARKVEVLSKTTLLMEEALTQW